MPRGFFHRMQSFRRCLPPAIGEAAVAEVRQLEQAAPERAAAWFQLGELWLDLGRCAEAGACLDKSLRLDSKHLPTRLFQALLHADRGDWDAARATIEQVLTERPDHEFARAFLDYVEFGASGNPDALRALAGSPFVFDQHLGGRLLYAVERSLLRQSKGRLADLFAELEVSPLGKWLFPLTRWGQRINAALRHPLNAARRRDAMALAEGSGLLAVGRPEEAARCVVGAAPSSPAYGMLMAELLLAGGELARLEQLLTSLVQADATLKGAPEYQLLWGVLLAEKGQYREAESTLATVPDDPWNFFPYYYRGLAATGLEKSAEARRWFARALDICTIQLVHRRLARRLASIPKRKH